MKNETVILRNLIALQTKDLVEKHSALLLVGIEILPENNVRETSERLSTKY